MNLGVEMIRLQERVTELEKTVALLLKQKTAPQKSQPNEARKAG